MGTYEDLVQTIKQTGVMKQALAYLQEEPVKLLLAICKEYEASNEPVSDHHFHLSAYWGEIALQALLSAGLLERESGDRSSIFRYKPTPVGIEHYKNLIRETRSK
jgi:hypothetical protein